MNIIVEEQLNIVEYFGDQHTIKDRLSIELGNQYYDPSQCDFVRVAKDVSTTIRVSEEERPFLVEGVENLYYVDGGQINWMSKEALFYEVADKTIANDIIITARDHYYDTRNEKKSRNRVLIASAMVLKHVDDIRQIIRVPYPLGLDLAKANRTMDLGANKMPNYYIINEEECKRIKQETITSIQTHLGINRYDSHLPVYSYNRFISRNV